MDNNYKVLMTLMGLSIGGAETHVLELCKALKKKGLDVYVASNGGAYEKDLAECGIKHFKVPLHNKQLNNVIKSYFALKQIITQNNIKLVHAHARIPAFLCGLLQKQLHFRFVTTAHWVFNTKVPFNTLTNWGEKSLVVSDDIKAYLTDNYGIDENNIKITVNGIDDTKFSGGTDASDIVREFNLDLSRRIIVHVSRLDKSRSTAAAALIRAVTGMNLKNVTVVIVGDGDDNANIKRLADDCNKKYGERVIVTTGARTDINKFLAVADIFVGASRSVLEAMSASLPVILAGNEGYLGIFTQKCLDTAVITNFCFRGCEATKPEPMAADLKILLAKSDAELAEMGAYSKKIVREYYSVEKMANDAIAVYESVRTPSKPLDVLISGYYGFNNNGDDALLQSIVDDLKRLKPDIKIAVLSKKPRETRRLFGVEAINRFNFPLVWSYIKKANVLITGGGTMIQDSTSTQSLLYYLWVINTAVKHGVKTMLYANGIGPVISERNRSLAKDTLESVDIITLRDAEALSEIKKLGVKNPNVHVTSDAVFSLKTKAGDDAIFKRQGLQKNQRYIIISIRKWRTLPSGFEQTIADFADYMKTEYDREVLFVPMQPIYDIDICKRIIARMKNKGILVGSDFSVSELMQLIKRSDFVLSMRLHMIVYAAKVGTPAIGLVYDPKVKGAMDMLGQTLYMDVAKTELDTLKSFTKTVYSDREKIVAGMSAAIETAKEKAAQNIKLFFELFNRKEF